ncbi:MAG: tetratricopeptide repeat protein [Roseivirga sp.]|nr:tetratricopeptide repeat protein [Roseivirga sp.]
MKHGILSLFILLLFACESNEDKAGRFFLMGNNSLAEGNFKEATRLYTEALQKNPKMKEAFNNRGVAYYKDKKYTEAIVDYTKAIKEVDAYYMDAWRNRADAYYATGLYDDALKDLLFLGEAYPDSAWVDFNAGLNFIAKKDYKRAINAFDKSLDKDSSNVEAVINKASAYYLFGYYDQANRFLDDAEKLDPSLANIYNTRALIATDKGNYDEALIEVNKALELEINNPYFNNNRGYIHLMTDQLEQAEKDINLGIKGDPQNGWAYRNKGIFYFMTDKFDDALRNFEQAGLYDESIPKLDYYWGATLIKLNRAGEACPKLKASVDAFENEGRALYEQHCGGI